jgi:hypothetical protein
MADFRQGGQDRIDGEGGQGGHHSHQGHKFAKTERFGWSSNHITCLWLSVMRVGGGIRADDNSFGPVAAN